MNAHRKYGLEYDPATISLQNMGLLVGKSFRSEIGEGEGGRFIIFFLPRSIFGNPHHFNLMACQQGSLL